MQYNSIQLFGDSWKNEVMIKLVWFKRLTVMRLKSTAFLHTAWVINDYGSMFQLATTIVRIILLCKYWTFGEFSGLLGLPNRWWTFDEIDKISRTARVIDNKMQYVSTCYYYCSHYTFRHVLNVWRVGRSLWMGLLSCWWSFDWNRQHSSDGRGNRWKSGVCLNLLLFAT